MRRTVERNWYAELWRDAFLGEDWFYRFLCRMTLLCIHAAVFCAFVFLAVIFSR